MYYSTGGLYAKETYAAGALNSVAREPLSETHRQ